jgi:hypothetical protein
MLGRRSLAKSWFCCALFGAFVMTPSRAHADGAAVAEADAEQRRAAQKTFEAGDELYESGRYQEALTAFRASLDLVASPNSRLMVARCLRELGQLVQAEQEFATTVRDAEASGGRYAQTADAARAEREAVQKQIAELEAAKPAEAPPPPAPSPEPSREVHTLEFGTAERESSSLRPYAYVSGAVGAVGLAGFGVFGAMSASRYSDLEEACPSGRCPGDKQADIDAGRRDQTIANVALVVGVVGVGVGVTLFVLSADDGGGERVGLRVLPSSAALVGSF